MQIPKKKQPVSTTKIIELDTFSTNVKTSGKKLHYWSKINLMLCMHKIPGSISAIKLSQENPSFRIPDNFYLPN